MRGTWDVVCVCEGQEKEDKKSGWKGGGKSHPVAQAQWADKAPPATPARARDPRRRPRQRGQLKPNRSTWSAKGGYPPKAPSSAAAPPLLVRHRTAEGIQGVARALNKVTDLLEEVQVQVKERTELKTENKELKAELAKVQEAFLVKEACDDSQDALLAQAQTDLCEANERADKAELEVQWLNDNRTAWVKGLLKDIDLAFDKYTEDSDNAKTVYDRKTDLIYHTLIDNLNNAIDQHLPSSPSSSPTASTKRATSPTIKTKPGNADKRAHIA